MDKNLSVVSDGMQGKLAMDTSKQHSVNDERISALSNVLQKASKTDSCQRAVVSFARANGSVRQHEVSYRWVEACGLWVVALRF